MSEAPGELAPSGFVDLQVNGCVGINFSDAALTVEDVAAAVRAQTARGTLAFCPTVITSAPAVYRRALPVLAQAMRDPSLAQHLAGIHLEGPFLSPEDGAVGAHPRKHTRQPDPALFEELVRLAEGRISILTLAPELPGALDLIRRARSLGITVGIGHSLADAGTVRAAVDAGASLSTHLGNGLPNLIHRHHNPLWPQIAHPALTAMLITDGHHLPPDLIAAVAAAKGPRRVIVTSDAAPAAGLPPGEYAFFGTRALLEPSGRLRNLERDTLAGSSAAMIDCMNHLAGLGLLDAAGLWRAGRDNPLAVLGRSPDSLPPGSVRFDGQRFCLTNPQ